MSRILITRLKLNFRTLFQILQQNINISYFLFQQMIISSVLWNTECYLSKINEIIMLVKL